MSRRRSCAFLAGLLACSATLRAQGELPDPLLVVASWNDVSVVAGRVIVDWDPAAPTARRALVARELGTDWLATLPHDRALLEDVDADDLASLMARFAGLEEVRAVQPDALLDPASLPDDPLWPQQWGLLLCGMDQAWNLEPGHAGSVVAVLDSGVDLDHPDLLGKLAWTVDSYAGDDTPTDLDGHGSHCAGIVSASTGNGIGMAGAAGACRVAVYRCGNASFPTSTLLVAIDDAVTRGAQVLSLSWGSPWPNAALHGALQAATAAGCLVVAAAGNLGTDTPFYPAAWDEVLGVASSDPFDGRSAFSGHGAWVDLAAPGQTILSTWKTGGYAVMSGTSMACPLVAGTAALLYARLGGGRSTQHADLVARALRESARPVGGWVAFGRLDPPAAVLRLDALAAPGVAAPASAAEGDVMSVSLTGADGAHGFLLLSASGATLALKGLVLLAQPLLLDLGSLPTGGLELSAVVPPGAAGMTLHLQLVAKPWGAALVASSPAAVAFTP